MKTTKFFAIISLVLFFSGINASFSKNVEPLHSKTVQSTGITYLVVLHPDFMTTPCGTYLVQIVDETGRLVAPVQVFDPGINRYSFNERISANANMNSRRVAILVPVKYPDHYICSSPLFTLPAVKSGPFVAGKTYTFDLYPQTKSNTID